MRLQKCYNPSEHFGYKGYYEKDTKLGHATYMSNFRSALDVSGTVKVTDFKLD